MGRAERVAEIGRRAGAHYEALPWKSIPEFFAKLRAKGGLGARALEFTILTCARSGETFGATWDEIDVVNRVWTIPADRMKEGREHRVPLTDEPMALLGKLPLSDSNHIFPGATGERLSAMTMTKVLRDLDRGDVTVHGFRSTLRDWAGDATAFDRALAEAALSHAVGDQTERAYRRGDALERRRETMAKWSGYCSDGVAADRG